MLIRLHKNATTTPAIRAYIQSSAKSVAEIAREPGVNQGTIRRWKSRTTVEDRPHTALHSLLACGGDKTTILRLALSGTEPALRQKG